MDLARSLDPLAHDVPQRGTRSHTMSRGWDAKPTATSRHPSKARHAMPQPTRFAKVCAALLWRRQVIRMIGPASVPELGGAVIDPNTRSWQVAMRAAQTTTPAFRIAVAGAVVLAGVATAAPASLAFPDLMTGHRPADTSVVNGSATQIEPPFGKTQVAPSFGETQAAHPDRLTPDAAQKVTEEAPIGDPTLQEPSKIYPDLDTALTELDQEADRSEAWAAQHPAIPAPLCEELCTGSIPPSPGEQLNPPPTDLPAPPIGPTSDVGVGQGTGPAPGPAG